MTAPQYHDYREAGKKRGPKYGHPGSTRNGFGQANQIMRLSLQTCPVCGRGVNRGGACTTQSAASGRTRREGGQFRDALRKMRRQGAQAWLAFPASWKAAYPLKSQGIEWVQGIMPPTDS